MVSKQKIKNEYKWHGRDHLVQTLARLKVKITLLSLTSFAAISWLPPLISQLFSPRLFDGHTLFIQLGCFYVDQYYTDIAYRQLCLDTTC